MTSYFVLFLDLMPKSHHRTLVISVLAATAVGCAAVPEDPMAQTITGAPAEALTGSGEKAQFPLGARSELVYQYLLAELATRRGDDQAAAKAMLRAATLSRDPDVVVRAYGLTMQAGHHEAALEMAQLLVKMNPDSDRLRALELQALMALERPDEFFEKLVAHNSEPGSKPGLNVRRASEILSRSADPSAWLPVMERLAERYHDEAEVHLAHAWLAYKAGRPDLADSALNHALALHPGWQQVALMKLRQLRKADDREALSAFVPRFLNDFPDSDELRLAWARLLTEWGEFEDALAQFDELVHRDPGNGDAVYASGVLSMEVGDFQKAGRRLEKYLELDPDHDQSRVYLSQVAIRGEQYDDALAWLEAVTDSELYFDAQLRIASVLAGAGRIDEAVEHLIEIVPDSVAEQVRIYLAHEKILRDTHGLDSALSLLDAALIDIPDNGDLLYARGLVSAQLKLIDKHEIDLRRLIELEPDNAHAYNALGYTLADQTDRLDEALILIERAIELLPGDPFILDSLGWVHYRLGHNDLAREYLQKAIDIRLDAEIAAHLGEVLWVDGLQDQAREVWQRGRQSDPTNPVLQETLRKFDL